MLGKCSVKALNGVCHVMSIGRRLNAMKKMETKCVWDECSLIMEKHNFTNDDKWLNAWMCLPWSSFPWFCNFVKQRKLCAIWQLCKRQGTSAIWRSIKYPFLEIETLNCRNKQINPSERVHFCRTVKNKHFSDSIDNQWNRKSSTRSHLLQYKEST